MYAQRTSFSQPRAGDLADVWGWVEPLWLLALAPLILLPGRVVDMSWHPWLVAALLAGWPLRLWRYGRLAVRTPFDWSLALLLLWLPVAYVVAVDKEEAWVVIGYLLLGVAIYFAAVNWPALRRRPEILGWSVLGVGSALSVLGFGLLHRNVVKGTPLAGLHGEIQAVVGWVGESANPNVLAGTLVLAVPMGMALAIGAAPRPL
jgi:hypothetical protein